MMHEFWENGVLPRGGNSLFIALIPKKENPQGLNKFRPISFVGCAYKIILKVLARRLKMVLGSIIHEKQSVFEWGRCMLDSW